MSNRNYIKSLNQDEVNKRILAKSTPVRSRFELLGVENQYRDETFEKYQKKRARFFQVARDYEKLNEQALVSDAKCTQSDYISKLNCDFLLDVEELNGESNEEYVQNGSRTRIRTKRHANENCEYVAETCTNEAWFRRYLTLNKFIQAVYRIIILNRLEKNLNLLKNVTPLGIEQLGKQKKCHNVSYETLFNKFI